MQRLELHPDRFFDPEPGVKSLARSLYESVAELPLVCPHGHVPVELFARNEAYSDPASVLLKPDHYIFRMLHSQGLSLDELGIPTLDGSPVESDPRKIWQRFADRYELFLGTPTRAWFDYMLSNVFGVRTKLDSESSQHVYDQILERLASPEFRPRALFQTFNIEVLATTDAASDGLDDHRAIRDSDWPGRVIPCFRPDVLFQIADADWSRRIEQLAQATRTEISSQKGFIAALEDRREFFRTMGATSTDHAVVEPLTHRLSEAEAEDLFGRALRGEATAADQHQFEAHMLMEMARMSVEDGLVMQLHAGSYRNHDGDLFRRFGPNIGADIPVATEFTRNLREILNAFGNDSRFTLVMFTLDESTYSRELAPMAGHYPALRLGPPWWFFDSIEGMRRFRERTIETAGIYNTAGFNDDARVFLSIPARHDLARRMDANYIARLVARHEVDMTDGLKLVRALAYELARTSYRLDSLDPD